VCWSIRSVFDTLDGIDKVTDDLWGCRQLHGEVGCAHAANAGDSPPTIESMKTMRDFMWRRKHDGGHPGTHAGGRPGIDAHGASTSTKPKNDDSFYFRRKSSRTPTSNAA